MLISFVLLLIVVMVEPLRNVFHLEMPDTTHWLILIGMMLVPLVVVNLFKLLGINTIKASNAPLLLIYISELRAEGCHLLPSTFSAARLAQGVA